MAKAACNTCGSCLGAPIPRIFNRYIDYSLLSLQRKLYHVPLALHCKPRGNPALFNAAGIEIHGKPARLAGIVMISLINIEIGSTNVSEWRGNGPVGVVGVKSTCIYIDVLYHTTISIYHIYIYGLHRRRDYGPIEVDSNACILDFSCVSIFCMRLVGIFVSSHKSQ